MTEIPKNRPLKDLKYLNSFRDVACWACGARDGTVVAAHIRHGHTGGMGQKPPDDHTLPLCFKCHAEQHRVGESLFWERVYEGEDIFLDTSVEWAIDRAQRRYKEWKEKQ